MSDNGLDEATRRMLAHMLHHGRFVETAVDPDAARRLVRLGYAAEWRSALGRDAIVLTDRGVTEARRGEHAPCRSVGGQRGRIA